MGTCPDCRLCDYHQLYERYEALMYAGHEEIAGGSLYKNCVNVNDRYFSAENPTDALRQAVEYAESLIAPSSGEHVPAPVTTRLGGRGRGHFTETA